MFVRLVEFFPMRRFTYNFGGSDRWCNDAKTDNIEWKILLNRSFYSIRWQLSCRYFHRKLVALHEEIFFFGSLHDKIQIVYTTRMAMSLTNVYNFPHPTYANYDLVFINLLQGKIKKQNK